MQIVIASPAAMVDLNQLTSDLQQIALPRSGPEFAWLVEGSYLRLCRFIADHLPRTGTLITATTLSLLGRYFTSGLRRAVHGWPFVLRTTAFIVAVGVGFGLLIASISPLVTAGLRLVAMPYLVPAVLAAFIVIGILAEKAGRI